MGSLAGYCRFTSTRQDCDQLKVKHRFVSQHRGKNRTFPPKTSLLHHNGHNGAEGAAIFTTYL